MEKGRAEQEAGLGISRETEIIPFMHRFPRQRRGADFQIRSRAARPMDAGGSLLLLIP
jgi:hypothetical protein